MDIRFKLRHTYTVVADSREGLLRQITIGHEAVKGDLLRMRPSSEGGAYAQRVYALQKFNAKHKWIVDEIASTKNITVKKPVQVQRSHWEAKVYDINLEVLTHIGVKLVQHARHFTVHSIDNHRES